jgi:hypothetical protein
MEISSSIVLIHPGMYILRYPQGGIAPLSVSRAPSASNSKNNLGKIEILATPGTQGSVLRNGSDCIVMQVSESSVELLISALVQTAGTAPAIRIDQIGLEPESGAALKSELKSEPKSELAAASNVANGQTRQPRQIEIAPQGMSIIGHIELKGDVVANEGETLGDPAAPYRLEGFQIMWPDRPEGVDLAYNIVVEGVGAMALVKTGGFCGTRGAAKRITEVTFALVGPQAKQYQLEGVAHFSGGFALPVASGMPLGGPSGVEHLTALSVRALPRKAEKADNPWAESSKAKVFKSKAVESVVKKVVGKAVKVK